MKYVLLVSHGTLASALHETLNAFFLGSRCDLLSITMSEGMGPDEFTEQARQMLSRVNQTDEIIVLADILGGSPLTYISYVVNEIGLLDHTYFLSGMNLPMIIDLFAKKDTMRTSYLMSHFLKEARETVCPFALRPLCDESELEMI